MVCEVCVNFFEIKTLRYFPTIGIVMPVSMVCEMTHSFLYLNFDVIKQKSLTC
jgi:hypothetical protein